MRESGYYWVRGEFTGWFIAYYSKESDVWYIVNSCIKYKESDLGEIDEKQITR